MNLREQELLNKQFIYAIKLCVNSFLQSFSPHDFTGGLSDPGSVLSSEESSFFPVLMHYISLNLKNSNSSTFFLPLYHYSCPDIHLK